MSHFHFTSNLLACRLLFIKVMDWFFRGITFFLRLLHQNTPVKRRLESDFDDMDEAQKELVEGRSGFLLWFLVILGPLGWGSFLFGDKNLNIDMKAAKTFQSFINKKKLNGVTLNSSTKLSSKAPLKKEKVPTFTYIGSSQSTESTRPKKLK